MDNQPIKNLLEDAYLVVEYAVRAGRLPDESLPAAIKNVEAAGDSDPSGLVQLSNAMNSAVAAVSPITLMDLRARRSPFDKDTVRSSRGLKYALCGLTVALAAMIAFYSFSVQRKESALREYDDIRTANISEKVDALYRLAQHDEVRARKEPRYEQYQHALNEVQELDARDQAAVTLLAEQSLTAGWPLKGIVEAVGNFVADVLLRREGQAFAADLAEQQSPYTDSCRQPGRNQPNGMPGTASVWREAVMRDMWNQSCFKEIVGIHHGMSIEASSYLYTAQIRDNVSLLSVWILPFLSGLLGATVFLLRDSLNPLTANFGLPRVVVRLALGAVAGIIIGWFWVPSGTPSLELGKGSSLPLALAFLTGFSIDILFSALDRVKETLTAARDPAPAPVKK